MKINTHSLNPTFITRNYDPGSNVSETYGSYLPPVNFDFVLMSFSWHEFRKQ